jgi:hypothetical protein
MSITIPDDRPFSITLVDKDERKLIPGTRHHNYTLYIYSLIFQAFFRVTTKVIIAHFSQIPSLKPQTLTGNHGSGRLTTTLPPEIEHLKFAVKFWKMGDYTEMIYGIEAHSHHIVWFFGR